jgi:hypothetical protein
MTDDSAVLWWARPSRTFPAVRVRVAVSGVCQRRARSSRGC